jgi:hypothetical protein
MLDCQFGLDSMTSVLTVFLGALVFLTCATSTVAWHNRPFSVRSSADMPLYCFSYTSTCPTARITNCSRHVYQDSKCYHSRLHYHRRHPNKHIRRKWVLSTQVTRLPVCYRQTATVPAFIKIQCMVGGVKCVACSVAAALSEIVSGKSSSNGSVRKNAHHANMIDGSGYQTMTSSLATRSVLAVQSVLSVSRPAQRMGVEASTRVEDEDCSTLRSQRPSPAPPTLAVVVDNSRTTVSGLTVPANKRPPPPPPPRRVDSKLTTPPPRQSVMQSTATEQWIRVRTMNVCTKHIYFLEHAQHARIANSVVCTKAAATN